MPESSPVVVCQCELEDGYIIKNFFGFNSLRGRPIITISNDKIMADNCTADESLHGSSYLHGDEIGLTWIPQIPTERRILNLTYMSSQNPAAFNRIKKKDQARIYIAQQNKNNQLNFDGPDSSDEFIIYVSCGSGGEGREGYQSIAATRVINPTATLIRQPDPKFSSLLVIPIRTFRQMVESFNKCKKQLIRVCFYQGDGQPGIMMTTDMSGSGPSGAILEKYGDIPSDEDKSPNQMVSLDNLSIDETNIVRTNNTGIKLILEEEKDLEPHEFVFDSDKVSVFNRLATMHNEGNVRIYYQPGCHLRVANRFGGFGECEINLHNAFVKV